MPAIAPPLMPAVVFAFSFLLTGMAVRIANRLRLLAHPVERSSHSIPTPQVGGVAICLAFLTGVLLLSILFKGTGGTIAYLSGPLLKILLLVTGLGCLFGFIDDLFPLHALAKLAALVVISIVPALFGICLTGLSASSHPLPIVFGATITVCWMLFFTNAFNFMDGVNGQSGAFAINALFWMSLAQLLEPANSTSAQAFLPVASMAAAAVGGFLPWNFPKASTFMGDSGSLPLGGILALLAVFASHGELASFAGYLLIFSPYIYDVLYTLCRRARRRENLLSAHRSHLYQRLLVATRWSHARLLVFQLPFYLLSGAAGSGYLLAESIFLRMAAMGGVAIMLAAYTGFVLRAERRAQ